MLIVLMLVLLGSVVRDVIVNGGYPV
jgi:hypothetical protein